MQRIDVADLRALGSASKALLGSVARDAKDQARHLAERRRAGRPPESGPPGRPARRRWRFKRRWVVVPLVITVVVLILLIGGAVLGLAALFGHL
jgi:hypothetical protein